MDIIENSSTSRSIPYVYMGSLDSPNLASFNTIAISLDARLDSSLDWSKPVQLAKKFSEIGYNIMWDIHLGLFKELHLSLSDTSQYKSLNLAMDHFFDIIINDFREQTLGTILYKGSIDLSHDWQWSVDQVLNFRGWLSEQFVSNHAFINQTGIACSDLLSIDPHDLTKHVSGKNLLRFYCMSAAIDYISMFTSRFDSDLLPYVLFDSALVKSPTHVFQLVDHEDLDVVQLALRSCPFESWHAVGWETKPFINGYIGKTYKSYQELQMMPTLGIVIPSKAIYDESRIGDYDKIIKEVEGHKSYKLIGERNITIDWQGLEEIIVLDIEKDSKRKLEGFIAAGGVVITEHGSLNLSKEIHLNHYLKSLRNI